MLNDIGTLPILLYNVIPLFEYSVIQNDGGFAKKKKNCTSYTYIG